MMGSAMLRIRFDQPINIPKSKPLPPPTKKPESNRVMDIIISSRYFPVTRASTKFERILEGAGNMMAEINRAWARVSHIVKNATTNESVIN
jgi:hypothetical protein